MAKIKKTTKLASDVFGLDLGEQDFDVQVFQGKHDHVPPVDINYQFREDSLVPVLWAIEHNKKAWLSGHTGTGKSTLIAQTCARLNRPMARINFDSEISRMDLIGRDILKKDADGVTISEFVDGILPQALAKPYVILCDEVDFIRPDVAYVFQRALEDEGLLISEDGGRLVMPHEECRIFATANTKGQGDDNGIYQGARAQSMAFLDRFTVWVDIDYLVPEDERKLIKALVPELSDSLLTQVMNYVREHRQGFEAMEISQPISPRTITSMAQACVFYGKYDNPLLKAAQNSILAKSNDSDKSVIVGILDRTAIDMRRVEKEKYDAALKKAKAAEDAEYKVKVEPEGEVTISEAYKRELWERIHGDRSSSRKMA